MGHKTELFSKTTNRERIFSNSKKRGRDKYYLRSTVRLKYFRILDCLKMNLVNFLILIKRLLNSEPTFLAFRHGIKVVPHILNLVIFVAVVNSSKTDQKYRTKYCIRQKSSDPLKISKSQMHKFWFPVIF